MATRTCVLHQHAEAVVVCIVDGNRYGTGGAVRDFCADCIDEGRDDWNFGRCYECADGLHERCIGVPCQCECPATDAERLEAEIASVEAQLSRLMAKRTQPTEAKETTHE